MSNTIILKGWGVRKEAKAASAITPGDFISISASGVARAAAGTFERTVAVENEVIGRDLNTDYAANDQVLYEAVHAGQEVNALVAAGAAAIALGAPLKIGAAGKLALAAGADLTTGIVVAYAMVALDNSGGGSPARIRVEIA